MLTTVGWRTIIGIISMIITIIILTAVIVCARNPLRLMLPCVRKWHAMTMLLCIPIVAFRNAMPTVMCAMLVICSRNVACAMQAVYGEPLRHHRRAALSEVPTRQVQLG